jgi:sn-glycerol 3-phosphate transport system substrate-binding protein
MAKKILTMMVTLALVLTSAGVSAFAESGSPIELTYWYCWTDKIQENNENLTAQFNDTVGKELGIHVTAEYQGTYDDAHQKLQAAYIADTMPDVSVMEIASIKTFAENGVIEPLSPYVEADGVDMTDFFEGLLENCQVDGSWYGIPYLRSTPVLYVNATLLEKAGLDPAGPKTYEELATYCKTVKEKLGVYGLSMSCYIWTFEAFMYEAGTSVLNADETATNINSPEAIDMIKFFKDLADEGAIRIVAGTDSDKIAADVINQNAAMWFGSTGDLTYNLSVSQENGFTVDNSYIPANVQYGVPTGGCNLVMASKISDEHKKAAWEFIKWMTAPEQCVYSSLHTGYVVTRKSAMELPDMQAAFEATPQYKTALDQLNECGHGRPMNPGYAEGQQIIVTMLESIWVNSGDVETEVAAAADKIDAALTE